MLSQGSLVAIARGAQRKAENRTGFPSPSSIDLGWVPFGETGALSSSSSAAAIFFIAVGSFSTGASAPKILALDAATAFLTDDAVAAIARAAKLAWSVSRHPRSAL